MRNFIVKYRLQELSMENRGVAWSIGGECLIYFFLVNMTISTLTISLRSVELEECNNLAEYFESLQSIGMKSIISRLLRG